MAKIYLTIVIISITLALVSAELSWLRQPKLLSNLRKRKSRKLLDRQESTPIAAPSPTPYPPAGVTPEIPFDLPTETEAPNQTYGGPNSTPGEAYLPPEKTPNQAYGPPEFTSEEDHGPPVAEDIPPIKESNNTYIPPTTENESAIEELHSYESNLVADNLVKLRKTLSVALRSPQLRFRFQ